MLNRFKRQDCKNQEILNRLKRQDSKNQEILKVK